MVRELRHFRQLKQVINSARAKELIQMRPDNAINFLQNLGFSVVSLPKADLLPGQTLLRTNKKELTRLGDLSTITDPGTVPFPPVSKDNVAPSGVSGKQSSSVDLNIGLSVLGNVLKALSGTTLGVEAAFKNNKSLTFAYQDVLEDDIALDKLDQYLSSATFKSNQNTVGDALSQNNVFVIVSTIKSKTISVQAHGDNDTSGKVDVPVINGIASGSLKADVSRAADGMVTFNGPTPVVFGVKAVQIFKDEKTKHTLLKPAAAKDAPVVREARSIQDKDTNILSLNGEGVFFSVSEEGAPTERTKATSK